MGNIILFFYSVYYKLYLAILKVKVNIFFWGSATCENTDFYAHSVHACNMILI